MARGLTAAAILAAGALLSAGCSGADTKSDYVDTLNGIQEQALNTFNQTVSAPARNPEQQAEQLQVAAATYDDILAELESVEVPEEAQAGHDELVAGYEEMRAVFDEAYKKAKKANEASESIAAVSVIGNEGAAIGERLNEALDQIRQDLD
jgi:hypothetical protein